MRSVRMIPCLDVDAGAGGQGRALRRPGARERPGGMAARYDVEGGDELVFLDITASANARETVVDVARRTAEEVFIPLTLGGGVRSPNDARRLLRAGADKAG